MPGGKSLNTTPVTAAHKAAAAKAAAAAAAAAPKKASTGKAIRTIGPAIPLAIALGVGALHGGNGTCPPTAPPSTPMIAQQSTIGTSVAGVSCGGGTADSPACVAPVPMLAKGHPVNWWFVFKLNAAKFPMCGGGDTRSCPFGADKPAPYKTFGQQYAYASSEAGNLQAGGKDCLGDTTSDPVGATFDEVYNGGYHYVIWNDQFYGDPASASCSGNGCSSPWGHSKGMLAWNDAGDGMVMQVSTPSWPASGSAKVPRKDGNTLGCVTDNDVQVSQHFFALKLTHGDVVEVLRGLNNASVATDPKNPQIANNGGPQDVQELVKTLGVKSSSAALQTEILSSGVQLIAKPSAMHVPPWQMVSSVLNGVNLRAATWWATPQIPSTTAGTVPACWDPSLTTKPGAVEIATSGTWQNITIGLKGGLGTDFNHAKIGVSTSGPEHFSIFGDMNQQGALSGNCQSSQNGRGGLFFVVNDAQLQAGVAALIAGESAPAQ